MNQGGKDVEEGGGRYSSNEYGSAQVEGVQDRQSYEIAMDRAIGGVCIHDVSTVVDECT